MKTTNFLLAIITLLLLLNLVNKSWFVTEANAQASNKKTNNKNEVLNVRIVESISVPVTSSLDFAGNTKPLGVVVLNKNYDGLFIPVLQVNK